MTDAAGEASFPLFPLNVVLFPDGLLPLRIFEPRYLDMITHCIKTQTTFGVVAAQQVVARDDLLFAPVGTVASIISFDVPQTGLMYVRCVGKNRFTVKSARQMPDGLWLGAIEISADEMQMALPEDLAIASDHLQQLILSLQRQGVRPEEMPVLPPYRFDDCGWVANRWCELLDLSLQQKQDLLSLDSPLLRLELVNDIFDFGQPRRA